MRICRLLLVGMCALALAAGPARADVYDTIKAQEANFPVPQPTVVIPMGTFNAATGQFTGKVSTMVWHPPDQFHSKPYQMRQPPTEEVNAVGVQLTFTAANRPAGQNLQVTANGRPRAANSDSITVDVGAANLVQWKVQVGGLSYADTLVIKRPPIIGAGAFTLPALPLVVIYAPPVDQSGRNRATYSTTQATGTTIGMSFSREGSTTRPSDPSRFSEVNDMRAGMTRLATAIKFASSAIPNAAVIAGGLEKIAGALGEASANQEVGTKVVNETSLEITDKVRDTYFTVPGKGPGEGDIIVYLRNARMVWLAENGVVTLSLLGQESVDNPSAADLLADMRETDPSRRRTGLDTETIRALLRLDPFVEATRERQLPVLSPARSLVPRRLPDIGLPPGPLVLPSSRFGLEVTYGVFSDRAHQFTHTVQQTDLSATTGFTLRTESFRKGFLSFLGVGVPETATVKTNVTHGSSRQVTTGTEVSEEVAFFAQPGENYSVEVYYDRIFGAFALKPVTQSTVAGLTGVATNAAGTPLPNQLVTLQVAGRKYQTYTDAQGAYAFRASTLRPGVASLMIGKTLVKRVDLRRLGERQDLRLGAPAPRVIPRGPILRVPGRGSPGRVD